MKLYFLLGILISWLLCWLIIKIKRFSWLTDHLHNGPQRTHHNPTPRIGGLAIWSSILVVTIFAILKRESFNKELLFIFLVVLPAFIAGLVEDITARVDKWIRIFFIACSSSLAFFIIDAKIVRVDLPIDCILQFGILSFIFTIFALVGITNSINIIDGVNGVASMVSIIILLSLAWVAYKLNDYLIITACISLVAALFGFFILNYPRGLIFLGDGGAYLVGFYIGIISVALVRRHTEVSSWFPFLACIYPIVETIFTIYRRKFIKKRSFGMPDRLHFHSLIYRRIHKLLLNYSSRHLLRSAAAAPFVWILSIAGAAPAIIFWNNTHFLIIFSIFFVVIYLYIYWRILLPKIPTWAQKKKI